MKHLVVPSDGSPDADHVVRAAAAAAGDRGTLVMVSVLPGSLVEPKLGPAARGRRRREEENRAKAALAAQVERIGPATDCHLLALFGDVVFDTLLVTRNLEADAVWMRADDPDLLPMLAESPVPVVAVPSQADAPT